MIQPKELSKRKVRGIVVLLIILFCIIIAPRLLLWLKPEATIEMEYTQLEKEIQKMEYNQSFTTKKWQSKQKKYKAPPQKFNPNDYQQKDWMALGLSEKQANVILKFSKYGIKNNERLKSIFVIDEALFELIKDSTFYSNQSTQISSKYTPKKAFVPLVNINTATKDELMKLPGIGDYFATKMVEYREKLGGYRSINQLLEIKNFDEAKLNSIEKSLEISLTEVKHININQCTYQDLVKHPYISKNVANSIVKMRNKIQKYTNFDQLLESEIISKELLQKIKPYLTLE